MGGSAGGALAQRSPARSSARARTAALAMRPRGAGAPAAPAVDIALAPAPQPASRGAGTPPLSLPGDTSDGERERSCDGSRSLAPRSFGVSGEADDEPTAAQLGLHCRGGEGGGTGSGGGGIVAAASDEGAIFAPALVASASIGVAMAFAVAAAARITLLTKGKTSSNLACIRFCRWA